MKNRGKDIQESELGNNTNMLFFDFGALLTTTKSTTAHTIPTFT